MGVKKVVDGIGELVKAGIESSDMATKLTAALKNAGYASDETRDRMTGFATALMNQTTLTDEAVQSAMSLELRLGMAADEIPRATKAAADMASVLGIDLNAAAIAVSKAHAGHLTILQRYGIQVDESKYKTEGFAYVLGELEKKFGGASEAMGNTFGGRLKQIKIQVDELKEALGQAITENPAWMAIVTFIRDKLILLNDYFKNNKASIQEWGSKAALVMMNASRFGIDCLLDLGTVIAAVTEAMVQAVTFIMKLDVKLGTAFKFEKDIVAVGKKVEDSMDGLGFAFQSVKLKVGEYGDELENVVLKAIWKNNEATKTYTKSTSDLGIEAEKTGEKIKTSITASLGDLFRTFELFSGIGDLLGNMGDLIGESIGKIPPSVAEAKTSFADLEGMLTTFGQVFESNMITNVREAARSWRDYMKDFLKDIGFAVAKMLLLRGAASIMKIPVPTMAEGGIVPGGAPYMDRVPVLATPGEGIVNRRGMASLGKEGLARINSGGGNSFPISIIIQGNADQNTVREMKRVLPRMIKEATRRGQL